MEHSSQDMVITQSEADLVNGLLDRIEYIAKLNPKGVRKLAYKHGYRAPEGLGEAKQFLMRFLSEGGEDSVAYMMEIHPDRSMLVELLANKVRKYNGDQFDYNAYDGDDHDSFIAAIANAVGGIAGAAKGIAGPSSKQLFADQQNNQSAVMQQAIAYKQKQEEEKNKTKRVLIWGSVGLFIVIMIGVVIWLYTSRKNK